MGKDIRDTLKMERDTDLAVNYGLMVQFIMENGSMALHRVMDAYIIVMEIYILDSG